MGILPYQWKWKKTNEKQILVFCQRAENKSMDHEGDDDCNWVSRNNNQMIKKESVRVGN